MRTILLQRDGRHELVEDEWRYLGEDAAERPTHPLIVPQARFLAEPSRWHAAGQLGVRAAPADAVEALVPELPRLRLVAIEIPGPGEGRGYSFARLLRQRYGFKGQVRAVGPAVKQDLIFLLARTGFDAFELAPGQDAGAAVAALTRYTQAYQAGVHYPPLAPRYGPSRVGSSVPSNS
jgi:uncharacterized protein (DUF934 family)